MHRPSGLIGDPEIDQQESCEQGSDHKGDRRLFPVHLKTLPEFLEGIDHTVAALHAEKRIFQGCIRGTHCNDRQTEDHKHQIGADDYAAACHHPAECTVIAQKAAHEFSHNKCSPFMISLPGCVIIFCK